MASDPPAGTVGLAALEMLVLILTSVAEVGWDMPARLWADISPRLSCGACAWAWQPEAETASAKWTTPGATADRDRPWAGLRRSHRGPGC
uniref:Uncharacterized protein n=1 Tax=Ralstonia solanacearum CFBP2957 TaxID=859656 RepID=D8P6I6_RALSL|nr:protein of unknown function [Ralstonia solanacearum CFBP2957]